MSETILIVEDDHGIADTLRRGLIFEGYRVTVAYDGEEALNSARDRMPDLVVLDWMLPGLDGLDVCKRLRAASDVPILMLTAKDSVADRVEGLDTGADDYLVKPFAFDELLARIRALLRRAGPTQSEVLHFADLELDTGTRQARRGGKVIELTVYAQPAERADAGSDL
jgi:two-component system response regulator MprA